MKYNIFNYNQEKSIEMGLDLKDLLILDWLQTFYPRMHKTIRNNKQYVWVHYESALQDIPILEIKTEKGLYKRMQAMCDIGVLEYLPIHTAGGCFAYYLITEKISSLIKSHSPESSTGSSESSTGSSESSDAIYKDSSIINSSIINSKEKDTASGSSLSQSSYSEIPNSSPVKENLKTQKQKDFEEFWEEFGNKVKRKDAVAKYKLATFKATHAEIMAGVRKYKEYLKVATWLQMQTPCFWLSAERWSDDFEELTKQEYKKQGKPLPITEISPEKQQEENKQREDTESKIQAIKGRLNAKEIDFNNYFKEHIKPYFNVIHYEMWIEDMIVYCRNKTATVRTIKDISQSWDKLKKELKSELLSKGFELEKIEWKLIN